MHDCCLLLELMGVACQLGGLGLEFNKQLVLGTCDFLGYAACRISTQSCTVIGLLPSSYYVYWSHFVCGGILEKGSILIY